MSKKHLLNICLLPVQDLQNSHLWEFVRDLLLSPEENCGILEWEEREQGIFRVVKSEALAKMWGQKKKNDSMTYEKLSRALRWVNGQQGPSFQLTSISASIVHNCPENSVGEGGRGRRQGVWLFSSCFFCRSWDSTQSPLFLNNIIGLNGKWYRVATLLMTTNLSHFTWVENFSLCFPYDPHKITLLALAVTLLIFPKVVVLGKKYNQTKNTFLCNSVSFKQQKAYSKARGHV